MRGSWLRQTALTNNIANADTPGYAARDFDFAQALQAATGAQLAAGTAAAKTTMVRTNAAHAATGVSTDGTPTLLYRLPVETALDGNTVEPDVERAAFVDNSLRYQEGLKFMTNQIKTMLTAVNGQ